MKRLSREITLVSMNVSPRSHTGMNRDVLPLGIASIGASAEAAGYDVDLRDYQFFNPDKWQDPANAMAFLEGAAPILGLSTIIVSLPFTLAFAAAYKHRHPEATILLGGPGVGGIAAEIMQAFECIDAVIFGEGEGTLLELLGESGMSGDKDIPGACLRCAGQVTFGKPRPRIVDWDRLPQPMYHSLPMNRYREYVLMTTRGCPFDCSFCSTTRFWNNRAIRRSIPSAIAELRKLVSDYGPKPFWIIDDTFTIGSEYVLEFCRQLKASGLRLPWRCYGRIDRVDVPLLRTMADAGCQQIYYGLESGSDAVLARLGKNFTVAQAIQTVEESKRIFPTVCISILWGLPFETMDDFWATIAMVLKLSGPNVLLEESLVSPLPGTVFFKQCEDQLQLLPNTWPSIVGIHRTLECPPEIEKTIRAYPKLFSSFYTVQHDLLDRKLELAKAFNLEP